MQIQWWEGAASSCAEAVLQSATRDCMRVEAGRMRKRIVSSVVEELEKDVRSEGRHRGTERVENTFELERVASCRSRDQRWRAKLDFRSGESFDDHHRSTTLGTRPKIARTGGGGLLLGLRCPTEQLEGKWQGGGTFAVGQEAEVADAHETFWEQVQQEAAQELIERKGHQLLFVAVCGIAPTKRDLPISKRDQAMVGDGHAMGVTAQITEHMLRASERWFRVDHPILSK